MAVESIINKIDLLLIENLIRLQKSFPEEEELYYNACIRAQVIAGIFNFLLEKKALNLANLQGKVADLGTGTGGGALAAKIFGAEEIIGVDHRLGLSAGLGIEDAQPSRTVFKPPRVTHLRERVEDFLVSQPPESFDLMTVFRMPPVCFPVPAKLCEMVYPLLKSGGQVVISMGEGKMIDRWDQIRLSVRNGRQAVEVVYEGENRPWWNVNQFQGRLFFLPAVQMADYKILTQREELVFYQRDFSNDGDKEVFIGTKLKEA